MTLQPDGTFFDRAFSAALSAAAFVLRVKPRPISEDEEKRKLRETDLLLVAAAFLALAASLGWWNYYTELVLYIPDDLRR